MSTTLEAIHKDLADLYQKHGLDTLTNIPASTLAELTTAYLGCLKDAKKSASKQTEPVKHA